MSPGNEGGGGFWSKMRAGLEKTRRRLVEGLESVVDFSEGSEEVYEELEALLVQSDMGAQTAATILDDLRERVGKRGLGNKGEVLEALGHILAERLACGEGERELNLTRDPAVILLVGVNGVGKTTTAAKLAHMFKERGHRPLLGAADTFRAAAIEQLKVWGERLDVDVIAHAFGADPGAVAFDAMKAARARGADIVILDTAGRLHTRSNLMEELSKIRRVIERESGHQPDEVLLVLDATTGQNALRQVESFGKAVEPTGIVLTKLDGTAKGGIVLAIELETELRVKLVGLGEGLSDLEPFDERRFVDALVGLDPGE